MLCCLNPTCHNPPTPDGTKFCLNCGVRLVVLKDRYRPVKSLGSGGFSKTYLAEDIDKLNEKCVIKQFVPQFQGTAALKIARELFEQEARQLQKLGKNLQIPTLLAYFEQDNNLYLVQEYIEGRNLLEELEKKGVFSEVRVRDLLRDLLDILKVVHQEKVIHRDIKPENILLRGDGKVFLIDFGASKQLTKTVMTTKGTAIGSFGYAPLEQMQGGEAYPASDLFSLGATCFHLLTGIHPWNLWQKQGYGWVARWHQHLKQPISQEFGLILNKLLQVEHPQRYPSVSQVLQDLSTPVQSSASSSQPANSTSATPSPSQKKSSQSTSTSPSPSQKKSSWHLLSVSTQPIQQKYQSTRGAFILILGLVGISIFSSTDFHAPDSNSLSPPPSSPTSTSINTLRGHTNSVTSVAISPDGKIIASGSRDKTIILWNLAKGTRIQTLIGHSDEVNSIAISPDGETLASAGWDKTIKLWNLTTGKLIRTLRGSSDGINAITISPNGKILASTSNDKTIKIWDFATGQQIRTLNKNLGKITYKSNIIGVIPVSASRTYSNNFRIRNINSLAFSPDNKTLAIGDFPQETQIQIWNLSTGKVIRTLSKSRKVTSVAFSPDGKTLASGHVFHTNIWNLSTGKEVRSLPASDWVNSVAFSPDGKILVSGNSNNNLNAWNLATETEIRTFAEHSGSIDSIAISPDGTKLVSGSSDNLIKIWRLPKI